MGTSKGYKAPSTPQWGKLKREVTRRSSQGAVSKGTARRLFRHFIKTSYSYGSGGVDGSSGQGRGGSGRGGGGGGGRSGSVISTGRRLAGFASTVAKRGVDTTFRQLGLGNLIGKSPQEVIYSLVEYLADSGTTLDKVDVRGTVDDIAEDLLGEAETYEDVKLVLEENLQIGKIAGLLFKFFSNYFYRRFRRTFYEHLDTRRGEKKTTEFFDSVKNFVASALENFTFGKDLTQINWKGEEGRMISEQIYNSTIAVFGE